jgi:hypothetical protein
VRGRRRPRRPTRGVSPATRGSAQQDCVDEHREAWPDIGLVVSTEPYNPMHGQRSALGHKHRISVLLSPAFMSEMAPIPTEFCAPQRKSLSAINRHNQQLWLGSPQTPGEAAPGSAQRTTSRDEALLETAYSAQMMHQATIGRSITGPKPSGHWPGAWAASESWPRPLGRLVRELTELLILQFGGILKVAPR